MQYSYTNHYYKTHLHHLQIYSVNKDESSRQYVKAQSWTWVGFTNGSGRVGLGWVTEYQDVDGSSWVGSDVDYLPKNLQFISNQ